VATFTSKIPIQKYSTDIYQLQVKTYALKLCKQTVPKEVLSICWNCKSIFRAMFFDANELQAIYRSEYIGMEIDVPDGGIVYQNNNFLNENSARTLNLVKDIEFSYGVPIRDIFDIGGRDGFRMKGLAEKGYSCKVFDPIPCETCSPLIAKEYILCSDIGEREKADLIILGSMLEHCENPHETIANCYAHLREGGFIFLDLPFDISAFFEWFFLRRWIGKTIALISPTTFFTRVERFRACWQGMVLPRYPGNLIPLHLTKEQCYWRFWGGRFIRRTICRSTRSGGRSTLICSTCVTAYLSYIESSRK